jgi:zinc transport system substrate-binding protein
MKSTLFLCLATGLVLGCSEQQIQTLEKTKPVIYTVNYPLAYFAERIGGGQVEVVFPEMEGDPAFWVPTAEDVVGFQDADLILLNGAAYAKWVPKVSLPQSRMLNTSKGFSDQYMALEGNVTHTHGPGGAHAHGDIAFTTWLDLSLAVKQAAAIQAELSNRWDIPADGFQSLEKDLLDLDRELETVFAKFGNQPLLGSHPIYQYLARRYQLNMQSVHWEPDAEPDDAMWRELGDILEAHAAKIMLWEDEPLPSVKTALAEKGIKSIVFNPCGNRPSEGNFMQVMQQNLDAVKELQ